MLKKVISYTNFDGEPGKITAYFNLTKTEVAELMLSTPQQDIEEYFENVVASGDGKKIIEMFKEILEKAYGIRDGEYFLKGPDIFRRFTSHPSYDEFFLELITNPEKASEFVAGVLPKDLKSAPQAKAPQDRLPATSRHTVTSNREGAQAQPYLGDTTRRADPEDNQLSIL